MGFKHLAERRLAKAERVLLFDHVLRRKALQRRTALVTKKDRKQSFMPVVLALQADLQQVVLVEHGIVG